MKRKICILMLALSMLTCVGGCAELEGVANSESVEDMVEQGKRVADKAKDVIEDEEVQNAAKELADSVSKAAK